MDALGIVQNAAEHELSEEIRDALERFATPSDSGNEGGTSIPDEISIGTNESHSFDREHDRYLTAEIHRYEDQLGKTDQKSREAQLKYRLCQQSKNDIENELVKNEMHFNMYFKGRKDDDLAMSELFEKDRIEANIRRLGRDRQLYVDEMAAYKHCMDVYGDHMKEVAQQIRRLSKLRASIRASWVMEKIDVLI
jgi:hypothetical protein